MTHGLNYCDLPGFYDGRRFLRPRGHMARGGETVAGVQKEGHMIIRGFGRGRFLELVEMGAGTAAEDDRARIEVIVVSIMAVRLRRKLTVADVAVTMGVTEREVEALEALEVDPQMSFLQSYARACGVPLRVEVA